MTNTAEQGGRRLDQLLADAGTTLAFAADTLFDTACSYGDQSHDFRQLEQQAGSLIGEGTRGDKILVGQNLAAEVSHDAEGHTAVISTVANLEARHLGLNRNSGKAEAAFIKQTAAKTVKAIAKTLGRSIRQFEMSVVADGDNLVVAHSSPDALPIYPGYAGGLFSRVLDENPLDPADEERYVIEVHGHTYDIRAGMTRRVYDAIRRTRGRNGAPELRGATLITGERTPRNGRWIADPGHGFVAVGPAMLSGQMHPARDRFGKVHFRPAVVLEGFALLGKFD